MSRSRNTKKLRNGFRCKETKQILQLNQKCGAGLDPRAGKKNSHRKRFYGDNRQQWNRDCVLNNSFIAMSNFLTLISVL